MRMWIRSLHRGFDFDPIVSLLGLPVVTNGLPTVTSTSTTTTSTSTTTTTTSTSTSLHLTNSFSVARHGPAQLSSISSHPPPTPPLTPPLPPPNGNKARSVKTIFAPQTFLPHPVPSAELLHATYRADRPSDLSPTLHHLPSQPSPAQPSKATRSNAKQRKAKQLVSRTPNLPTCLPACSSTCLLACLLARLSACWSTTCDGRFTRRCDILTCTGATDLARSATNWPSCIPPRRIQCRRP